MREPFAGEHAASVARKASSAVEPQGFRGLLRWFLAAWADEMPDEIHTGGVWRDRRTHGDPQAYRPVGGSLLGAPQDAPPFAAHMYGSAFRLEHPSSDGRPEVAATYASPLMAAITWLEYKPRHRLKARLLRALGRAGGDWQTVTLADGLPEEIGQSFTIDALRYVYRAYQEAPLAGGGGHRGRQA